MAHRMQGLLLDVWDATLDSTIYKSLHEKDRVTENFCLRHAAVQKQDRGGLSLPQGWNRRQRVGDMRSQPTFNHCCAESLAARTLACEHDRSAVHPR
jgi:hypothetical protein